MTTTTIYPNGTVQLVGASPVGEATAHEVLSELTGTSSYLDGTSDTYYAILDLETIVLSGGVVKSAGVLVIAGGFSGTSQIDVRLQNASNNVYAGHDRTLNTSGDSILPYSYALSALAGITTQTAMDGLRVRVDVADSPVELYRLGVNIQWVARPVIDLPAIATPTSTVVPVTWSSTLDADGGSVTHHQIKVFDETTYGAGFSGLDIDTDTPIYETGAIASGVQSASIGPLPNGDTYRCAVRTGQTVNGAILWSTWETEDFTISLTTSDVSSVTAAATDADGKVTVTVSHAGATPDWEKIEVQRSIDGGTTWTDVRFATLADATGDLSSFVVDDHEVGNTVDVDHRARATYYVAGEPVTGDWVQTSSSTQWSSDDCWLKDPLAPTNSVTFKLGGREPATRSRRVGVFNVVDAEFPVTVSDRRSGAVGVLPVWTDTVAEADALEALLAAASTLLVQHPPSMNIPDRYSVIVDDSDVLYMPGAEQPEKLWNLSYVQAGPPADPTAGEL